MRIAPCNQADLGEWTAMRHALWPDETGLEQGAAAMLAAPELLALIARDDAAKPLGFAEAAIRHDYVNGCDTSPVLFLEGIYVAPAHRRTGIARALAEHAAQWGRAFGCTEFASDALLDNAESHAFHAALGFAETERVVYFCRSL